MAAEKLFVPSQHINIKLVLYNNKRSAVARKEGQRERERERERREKKERLRDGVPNNDR